MTRLALEEVSTDWKLDTVYEVRRLQSFLAKLSKIRPELADTWHFSDYLKINPKINLDQSPVCTPEQALEPNLRHAAGNRPTTACPPKGDSEDQKKMTVLEILSQYSIDPDDGRDQDLFIRDAQGRPQYAFSDQKWFGAMQGPDSQAFRHLEKTPFDWKHWESTLGLPLQSLGEATQRAEIYFQLSQLAFALEEPYWGWRFLGGSLHYLEDLHNPYHAAQISYSLAKKVMQAYVTWGWKSHGFIPTCSHVVSNSHRFFESYVFRPGGNDHGQKAEALALLKKKDTLAMNGSVKNLAEEVRNSSNVHFATLTQAVVSITHPTLFGPYRFQSDKGLEEDPLLFIQKVPDFEKSNQIIFGIVKDRFESAGWVIRTVVKKVEENRLGNNPDELLKTLDRLLN